MPKKKTEAEPEASTPAVEFVPECPHRILDVQFTDDMARVMVQRVCGTCGKSWEPMPQSDVILRRVGSRF